MRPEDLIAAALRLLELDGPNWIRQAFLRRALSTVYLALFYAICFAWPICGLAQALPHGAALPGDRHSGLWNMEQSEKRL